MIVSSSNKSNQQTLKTDINFYGIGLHSGIYANVKITSDQPNSGITFIRTDLKEDNKGYEGIVHGGERIYFEKDMIGRIQFNTYNKNLDLYEATAYIPIELHSSKKNLNVAIHNSFAKANIIDGNERKIFVIHIKKLSIKPE